VGRTDAGGAGERDDRDVNGILLVLLALGAIAVAAFGHRVNAQPGLLILAVSAGISFIPSLPRLELDPELILGVIVPPLLYAAALEFSFFSFVRNIRSILGLGVGLVVVTDLVTRYLTAWMLPTVGAAAAFVLAAIVAPPDTVTITAHGEQIGLPRRVTAILTGESLVNDAAALALFTAALAAVTGHDTFIGSPVWLFLYAAVVGVLIGLVLGSAATWVRARLGDPTLATAMGLVVPFAAYLAAESAEASGVLAVVMAGFTISIDNTFGGGRNNLQKIDYRIRLTETQLWPVINSVLEAFVFAYTGLQLRFVIDELRDSGEPLGQTVLAGLVVLLALVLVRFAWVLVTFGRTATRMWIIRRRIEQDSRFASRIAAIQKRRAERHRGGEPPDPLGWKECLLVAWTGMRGIVTLGAAGGIPLVTSSGAAFPHRTTLQFLAYVVVIGTLLLQGPTLPLLARRLRIDTADEEHQAAQSLTTAREIAAQAGTDAAGADAADAAPEAPYDKQREALSVAVHERRITDEAAREVIGWIDRQQAAAE
jgi:NhaP-type Na+/H+ or K+/H+ antiporter